jgi:hypothetical protein
MNYEAIYNSLIEKRKSEPSQGYTENHHIIMKSMGGPNDKDNLVTLTGREHWIAHLLLFKIHRNKQTAHACQMMAMNSEERGNPRIANSRMYEAARKACLKYWKAEGKKRVGKANGSYGTIWICNVELRQNKKIPKNSIIPKGWTKGRSKWNVNICKRCKNLCDAQYIHSSVCDKCKNHLNTHLKNMNRINRKKEAESLWKDFSNGDFKSITQFAEFTNHSQQVISMWFREFIPEYRDNSLRCRRFTSKKIQS